MTPRLIPESALLTTISSRDYVILASEDEVDAGLHALVMALGVVDHVHTDRVDAELLDLLHVAGLGLGVGVEDLLAK